jgi:O-antigen ligase
MSSSPSARQQAATRYLVVGAPAAVLSAAHLFYGGYPPIASALLVFIGAALLAIACTRPAVRADLAALRPAAPIALLFSLVIVAALISLTPAAIGGPHPLWAWVPEAGAAGTIDKSATRFEILKLLGVACWFVLGCVLGAQSARARSVIAAVLAVGGAYALIALIQFLAEPARGGVHRLFGGFASANAAASVVGSLLVITVAYLALQTRRGRHDRGSDRYTRLAPALALILLFAACLALTGSRGGLASTAVALAFLFVWDSFATKANLWRIGGGLVAGVVAAAVFITRDSPVLQRLAADTFADDARHVIFQAHWQAFLDAPIGGYGLGAYPAINNMIVTPETYPPLAGTIVLHNTYLQWLEEAGVVGAAPLFLVVAVILGATVWFAVQRKSNRTLIGGLLAASVLLLLHASVDVGLQTPSIYLFWSMLLGFGLALSQAATRAR